MARPIKRFIQRCLSKITTYFIDLNFKGRFKHILIINVIKNGKEYRYIIERRDGMGERG